MQPAAWHPDPSGRYPFRWWDGQRWTGHVVVDGQPTTDPTFAAPPPPPPGGPAAGPVAGPPPPAGLVGDVLSTSTFALRKARFRLEVNHQEVGCLASTTSDASDASISDRSGQTVGRVQKISRGLARELLTKDDIYLTELHRPTDPLAPFVLAAPLILDLVRHQ